MGIGGIPIVRPTEADAIAVVQRALDLGITLIDTANGYSTSEERIGKALASSGRRGQVVLATKSHARVGPRFCRQCEYCMPCPQEVHIPGIMYLPILWDVWPPDWFFAWSYVRRAVETAQQCIECGECEVKCPYHLPIREMIAENLAFYERVAAEHHPRGP